MAEPKPDAPTAPVPAVRWEAPTPAAPNVARSARTRSRLAIAALAISAVVAVLAFMIDLTGLGVIDRLAAGELALVEAEAFDSSFASMGLIQAGAFILTGIAFLAWLSRSVDNVPALGGGTPMVTPAWSIGWWFIPFANLVMPFRIVADLYRRMASGSVGVGLVLAWWALWVTANVVSLVAGASWTNALEPGELRSALTTYAVSDILDLPTALLAILIVTRIQGWADARSAPPTPTVTGAPPVEAATSAPAHAAAPIEPDQPAAPVSWASSDEPPSEAPRVDTPGRPG